MKKKQIPKIISSLFFSSGLLSTHCFSSENVLNHSVVQPNVSARQKQFLMLAKELESIQNMDSQTSAFRKKEARLNALIKRLEKLKLNADEEKLVGWTLNRLANIYCPSQAETGCRKFDEKAFKRGNAFKRREFELHCSLHADRGNQIKFNLALMNWYLDRRRTVEVENQRKVLGELMDTLNPIFPNGRSICGQILNDENGVPIRNRIGDIGCGLG